MYSFLAEVYVLSVLDGAIHWFLQKNVCPEKAQTHYVPTLHLGKENDSHNLFMVPDQNGDDLSTVYQDIKETFHREIVVNRR